MRPPVFISWVVGLLFAAAWTQAETRSLGVVFQGEETVFELSYANAGQQPVWVVDATSSCECLVGRFAPVQVAPGGTARLRFAYRSDVGGRFSVNVQVRGPEASEVFGTYTVTGFVAEKAWLLPVARLLGPDRMPDVVIVDTRSPDKFARGHLPRSLNLPAFAIKSRRDLRERPLVLVDEGFAPALLLEEADKLRRQGFRQLFVLDGGLAAWIRQGGPVEGPGSTALAMASLSAADFVRTSPGAEWHVVEIKGPGNTLASPASAARVDRWEDLARVLPALSRASAGRQLPRILVIAPDAATSDRIEARFGGRYPAPLFYLSDGRSALEAYLQAQAASSSNPRQIVQVRPARGQPVVAGGCNTCPK
ncbi:MAG: DUF1573 domain-containing protein [Opitutaceae bacterium]|nr:DUF1573 domain-containing protein [Opitutaceae bacterium]